MTSFDKRLEIAQRHSLIVHVYRIYHSYFFSISVFQSDDYKRKGFYMKVSGIDRLLSLFNL